MDNMGYDLNSFLVTGSTGLLGREIERNTKDYNSKFFFTSRSPKKGNLQCDLTSLKDVKNLADELSPSCIIHCAAYVPKILDDYDDFSASEKNIQMLENLLLVFSSPIVLISSMTVYGMVSGEPVSENNDLNPQSAYGRGKMRAENILLKADRPSLSVRIPGLYGSDRNNGLVYNLIHSLKENITPVLPLRPLLWAGMDVSDAAKIILMICHLDWSNLSVINVGYRDKYSINRLVAIVSGIFNKSIDYNIKHPTFQFDLNLLDQMGVTINNSLEQSIRAIINKHV